MLKLRVMNSTGAGRTEILSGETTIAEIMEDERLTSVISNNILISADVSRKKRKKHVDKMAASIILQSYLDRRKD